MSITPIEGERDDREGGRSADRTRSGVRGLFATAWHAVVQQGQSALRRMLSLFQGPQREPSRESRDTPDIRVSGQRRLVSERTGSETRTETRPLALPESAELESERTDDSMRVYDPGRDDAYIVSDTWQNVEQ